LVGENITLLRNNKWKANDPVYFYGSGCWTSELLKAKEKALVSFFQALRDNSSATTLVLRNIELTLSAQMALEDVLRQNNSLQSISLINIRLTQNSNKDGGENSSSSNNKFSVPISLFTRNGKNNIPSLRELNIEKCNLNSTGGNALGVLLQSENCSLASLTLVGVELEESLSSKSCLVDALSTCHSLERLVLQNIHFKRKQEDLHIILQALGNNRSLKVLQLEKLGLEGVQCATHLSTILANNENLVELSLRKNDFSGEDIGIMMKNGCSLSSLYLSNNPIGDDGAKHLVSSLQDNSTLRELCLVHTDLWRDGCLSIIHGLQNRSFARGLRKLQLDGNEAEECAAELLKALKTNVTIERVLLGIGYLKHCYHQQELWKRIDFYLRWNQTKLRRVLVEDDPGVPVEVLPRLLATQNTDGAAAKQPKCDVLYEFLRHYHMPITTSVAC